jgi:magnesium chelatase accessory protein
LPIQSQNYWVIAPNFPGHGFTRLGVMQRSSLPLMAQDIASLFAKLEVAPLAIVGHSAGAALALQLALLQRPRAIIGLNAALDDFKGVSGWLFPMMAKVLVLNPLVSATFARLARNTSVQNLVEGTGSNLDARGLDLYRATLGEGSHIDGTLTMMAQWRLSGLRDRLPGLDVPTLFLAGGGDLTVPPETSAQARTMMPDAHFELLRLKHQVQHPAPVGHRMLRWTNGTSTSTARNVA